jgi:hypothetical protein
LLCVYGLALIDPSVYGPSLAQCSKWALEHLVPTTSIWPAFNQSSVVMLVCVMPTAVLCSPPPVPLCSGDYAELAEAAYLFFEQM